MTNTGEQSNHPACAACKYQRKKCAPNCILRRHFPAANTDGFAAVHKIFGVANVTKMMREANSPAEQDEIAKSLYWEAAMWVHDPVRGPYGALARLQDEIRVLGEHVNRQQRMLLPTIDNFHHGNMNMPVTANPNGNGNSVIMIEHDNYVNGDNNSAVAVGAVSQRTWLQGVESRFVIQEEGNIRRPLLFSGPVKQFQGIEGHDFVSNGGHQSIIRESYGPRVSANVFGPESNIRVTGNIGFNEGRNHEELDVSWQQQNYRSSKHEKMQ